MTVSVAARALLYDRQAEAGLIGRIFRQDPEKGLRFVEEVTVPITDYTSDSTERLPSMDSAEAGKYLFQLSLPNGEVMTESFEVAEGKATEVVLEVGEGPREWSTLQAMAGKFAGEVHVAMEKPGSGGVAIRSYNEFRQDPENGFQLRFISLDSPAANSSLLQTDSIRRLADLLRTDPTVEDAEQQLGTGAEVLSTAQEDAELALFEFVYEGSIPDGAGRSSYYIDRGNIVPRAYLLEKAARGARLIALPVPWTSFGNEVEVQLMLKMPSLYGKGEPDYTITIGDPMINSALGYVNNGAVKEAASLISFGAAQDLLFHKMSNPLAATVGGYMLILGLDRKAYRAQSDAWMKWVDNLCKWFPWLPDGAVLKAAKYFVLGDKDRDGAFDALMMSFDRGLPVFTFGLNLMLEGMRRFANEGEAEARERLAVLETLAAAADPELNFVTLEVARKWASSEAVHASGAARA